MNTPSFQLGNTPKRFRKVFRVSLSLILVATLMVPVTAWGENDMSVPEQEKSSETPAIPEDSMLSERDVIGIESEVEKPLDASKESSGSGVIDPIVDQPSANVEKTPETPPTGDPEKSVRSANGVAQVDSNEAMREAVVNVEAGSTIQLAGDIDLGTEMLTISKNLTLDLAGHTLNSQVEGGGYALNGSVTSFKPAIEIKDTSFTLQDSAGGGVATTKGGSVFAVSGSSEDPNNLIAMFVVKGGTVKSEYKPIMTSRASVLLDGGVIESKWDGIYATMSSQVTVLAGSISVDHGPDSTAGAVNLSYGSSLNVEGGTLTTTQCPVVFCYANWSAAPTSTVSISGGTLQTGKLEGAYALSLLNKTSADMPGVIVDISGGSIIGPWYFAGPRETLLHIGENAYLSEGFEVKEGTPFCTPVEGVARKPIEGGTFGFDPSQYVNTGTYSVTEKEGTWTVAPREDRADTSWYKTDEKDFTINTSQQLAGLAVLVNEGNDFEGKTITLANDINLSAFENWIPIGTGSGASLETATGVFRGIFDGGNKKISGLKISGDSSYVGLFGTVTTKDSNTPQATVRNVTLVDPRVGGATYVGGLIGHAHRADVQNCHVAGEINISGNKYVGGLVGHGYVSITGSSITGAGSVRGIYQNGGGYSVGGIIGFTGESNEPENLISECSVSGVTVSGTARTGGLVGYQHGGVGILKCQVSDVTVAFETANVPEDFLTGDMASTAGIGGLVGVANGQVGNDPSSNLTPPGELSNCTISNTTLVTDGAGTPAAAGYLYGKLSNSAAKPTVTNCVAVGCTGSTVASDNTVYKGSDGSVACVSVKRGEEELIFFSLKEAFDAAQSGDILTMTSDVVIGSDGIATLGEGKSITFDMAAKKITVTADFKGRPLMNYGTLTVCGNGAIDSSASELGGYGAINNYGELTIVDGLYRGSVKAVGASIFNRSGATLVVKGGTLGGATCALYNEGKATINGGVFDSISCNHIKVNGESIHSCTIRSFGELQFNDGSVTGVQGALSVSSGEAEINGGIFTARRINQDTCTFHALYVAGEVGEAKCDIKGGTFKSEYRQALWVGNDNTNGDGGLNEPATANIYGGSFWNTECSTIAFLTGPATGTPRVYGGEFSGRVVNQQDSAEVDLSEYVAPSSKVIEEGGRVKVVERTAENSIAKLGDLYFDDLKEALTAADQMEPKAVIELLSDTTVSSSLAVPDGKDVTLKGNGKTITGKGLRGSNTDKNALFLVSGNLTLENVNVKNVGIGVRAQGVGSVVTVTDSDIEAGHYALALRNKEQKLKVSNSTLTGWAGIMTSAGDVTLNNNTGASIDVTGSTINCKPVTNEPYGAIVLQENFHGVTVLVEDTNINLSSNSQSAPKPLAFDIRAYGSTVTAQNVNVTYDESVTTADAVFALKQYSSDKGEVRPSSITFTGKVTAPENLDTVIYGSESGPEQNIRRVAGDLVSVNGFEYAPDANGVGHRLFTADDVALKSLVYTGSALNPIDSVKAGTDRVTLSEGIDYSVTYKKADGTVINTIVDAGNYKVVVAGMGLYRGTNVEKEFEVSRGAGNKVVIENTSTTYNNKPHGLASVVPDKASSTLFYSTDEGVTWSKVVPTFTSVGAYSVQVKATNPNYEDTPIATGTVTIARAKATITVAAASKVAGNADPVFTGALGGFIAGDNPQITYHRTKASEGNQSVGADIDITATCKNPNYSVTVVPAKLTIVKAAAWTTVAGKNTYYRSILESLKKAAEENIASITVAHGTHNVAWSGATCLSVDKDITLQGESGSTVVLRPASVAPQNGSVISVSPGAALTLKNIVIANTSAAGGSKAAYAILVSGSATLNASLCSFDTGDAISLASGAKAALAKNFWGKGGPDTRLYGSAVYPYYKEATMATLVYQTEEKNESEVVGNAIEDIASKKPDEITKEDAASVVESLTNASQSTRDELAGKSEQLKKIEEAYVKTEGVTTVAPDDANLDKQVVSSATVTGAALSVFPSSDSSIEHAAKMVVSSVDIPSSKLPAGVDAANIIPLDISLDLIAVSKTPDQGQTLLASGVQPVAPLTITMTVANKWGSDLQKVTVAHYHNDEVSFIRPTNIEKAPEEGKLTLTFTLTKLSSIVLVAMDQHKIAVDEASLVFGEMDEGYEGVPAAKTVTITNQGTDPVTLVQPHSTDAFEVGTLSAIELPHNGATATFTVQPKTGLTGGSQQTLKEYAADIIVSTTPDANVKASLSATFSVKGKPEAPEQLKLQAYSASFDGREHAAVEVVGGTMEGDVYSYFVGGGAEFTKEVPHIRDAGTYPLVIKVTNPIYADRMITLDGDKAPSITPADAAQLTIDPISAQTYTGGSLTPKPVVHLGDEILIEDRDYTLSYVNNVEPGEATVTVAGIDNGNIAGSKQLAFTIEKAGDSGNSGAGESENTGNAGGSQSPSGKDASAVSKLLRTGDGLNAAIATGGGMALLAAFITAAAALYFRRRRK